MKRSQIQIKKPVLNTSKATKFASESIKIDREGFTKKKVNKGPQIASEQLNSKRVFFAPVGDKRLTINIKKDLHKKLKIEAITHNTTVGEIIETLIERHL